MPDALICRTCGGKRRERRNIYPLAFGPAMQCVSTFHNGDKREGFVPTRQPAS